MHTVATSIFSGHIVLLALHFCVIPYKPSNCVNSCLRYSKCLEKATFVESAKLNRDSLSRNLETGTRFFPRQATIKDSDGSHSRIILGTWKVT